MPRQYLIDARTEMGLTPRAAAHLLRISPYLYNMLEQEAWITHPNIARRIKRLYHLTEEQCKMMVHKKHWQKEGKTK